ncbi:MAG: hypothetical protein ACPGUD_03985 [Parashewanella sp.]
MAISRINISDLIISWESEQHGMLNELKEDEYTAIDKLLGNVDKREISCKYQSTDSLKTVVFRLSRNASDNSMPFNVVQLKHKYFLQFLVFPEDEFESTSLASALCLKLTQWHNRERVSKRNSRVSLMA